MPDELKIHQRILLSSTSSNRIEQTRHSDADATFLHYTFFIHPFSTHHLPYHAFLSSTITLTTLKRGVGVTPKLVGARHEGS